MHCWHRQRLRSVVLQPCEDSPEQLTAYCFSPIYLLWAAYFCAGAFFLRRLHSLHSTLRCYGPSMAVVGKSPKMLLLWFSAAEVLLPLAVCTVAHSARIGDPFMCGHEECSHVLTR